ncbi:hypothetical protein Tco_0539813 [Tanacetum coccineum]
MRMLASIRIDWFVISVSPLVASIGIDWFVISVSPLVASIGIDWFVISVSPLVASIGIDWFVISVSPLVACIGLLDDLWMYTPVFVDPESSTQADGDQSSRVPVPFPEDPYKAIRQAYLVRTDTKSEPIEDLRTESPESPHIVASPISFPDSTPPVGHVKELEGSDTSGAGSTSSDSTTPLSPDHPLTHDTPVLVPSLRRTVRMAVRVQPTMSPSCSARIAEVAAMFDVAFRKRFRPLMRVHHPHHLSFQSGRGIERTRVLLRGDEDPGMRDEGFGLGKDEAVPEGQQQAAPIMETAMGEPLGLGNRALRRRELAVEEDQRYSTFEVGQGSGSAPEPERLERVSAFRQPTLTTWTDRENGTIYIDVPTYPPPAPHVQTPHSPDWMPGGTDIKEMDKNQSKNKQSKTRERKSAQSQELSSYGQQNSTLFNNGQLTK